MTYIIEYATISPAILSDAIRSACMNALPIWSDINEEYFELRVHSWLPLTTSDKVAIERVLVPYI